jgi:tyrosyl-tRNA synthetase
MSKSLGNYVGITESPEEMFGKLMSISDELMWRYLELLSARPLAEIERWREEVDNGLNPRDVKVRLAEEMVERFHSREQAVRAHESFVARFAKGALPEDIPELEMRGGPDGVPIANLLKQAGLVPSTSEALRMLKQGAVRINGERVEDRGVVCATGTDLVYQVGKRRFARVKIS